MTWGKVKRYAKKAGIQKNVFVHTLRATFGTNVYKGSGKDVRLTQELMRHKDAGTTMIYVRMADTEIKEAFGKIDL